MKGLAVTLFVLVSGTSGVLGQSASPGSGSGDPAPTLTTPAETAPAPQIDPEKLPVSIGRIRLQLKVAAASKFSGLKIQETVEVVGVAPKIEFWNPETAKLATGPVPYGAPTHKEFINLVTPQEFKNYPMDLNALMQWLMEHLAEKKAPE
jgi:hypothetical protein